jgi:hypothetical protein
MPPGRMTTFRRTMSRLPGPAATVARRDVVARRADRPSAKQGNNAMGVCQDPKTQNLVGFHSRGPRC